jgi:hypothetical protein
MILLDKPYVSNFFKQTIASRQYPVINTGQLAQFGLDRRAVIYEPAVAIEKFKNGSAPLLYTNSENSINWITHHLAFTDLPRQINLLKDKAAFRELTKNLFPNLGYRAVDICQLDSLEVSSLKLPFVIKPAFGFFSMGVYKVSSLDEWPQVRQAIYTEMQALQAFYPVEVLDTSKFVIEDCIEGTEFAIDAFYNNQGRPVIVDIYQHLFASEKDVSDRVYFTSKPIIMSYQTKFEAFLAEIGQLAGLKNFPVHAEVRMDEAGNILPIEINPLRFGGWCATDIAYHAYQVNPYWHFFEQKPPDWDELLAHKGDQIYGLIVLDKPDDVAVQDIKAFDYERLLAQFEKPLELRRINYHEYPVFGFLFTETRPENMAELEVILRSDLKEFIRM